MGVAAGEDRPPAGHADRTIGVGAPEARALPGQLVHLRRAQVRIAGVGHGLAPVLVGEHVDDVRLGIRHQSKVFENFALSKSA